MMVTRIRNRSAGRQWHLYIAEWMKDRGLNDERLAGRLSVDRVTVTRWRNQQHRLNPGKMAAIEKALNLDPGQLWRPPPPPDSPPSLDAMVQSADSELRAVAVDIVQRLVAGRKS